MLHALAQTIEQQDNFASMLQKPGRATQYFQPHLDGDALTRMPIVDENLLKPAGGLLACMQEQQQ